MKPRRTRPVSTTTAAPSPAPRPEIDHRALLFRAVGVPDAVVDKVGAAAWLTLTGAGLEEHERFDILLTTLREGTAATLVDEITRRLEAGEFDALFVHRTGASVDALASRISEATLHGMTIEAWRGRPVPVNKRLCHDICAWVVTQVVRYVDAHPFEGR